MGGRAGAGAGGIAGREADGSTEIPGSCLVVRLMPSKADPRPSREKSGCLLRNKSR